MGNSASKTLKRGSTRLPTPKTRQQILQEEPDTRLKENLKHFVNPKQHLTPLSPQNPMENINVQTLRHQQQTGILKSGELTKLLQEKDNHVARKHQLAEESVRSLSHFLKPV